MSTGQQLYTLIVSSADSNINFYNSHQLIHYSRVASNVFSAVISVMLWSKLEVA